MKKFILFFVFILSFIFSFSQGYPIQQFIGADSAVVTSKGGLQGRFINVVFADTTAANSQRVRQYPGAMIYASGKLWVRNTTATAWNELAYNITPVNIYNSNGSLTSNRTLDGDGYSLTFDQIGGEFGVGADSINFNPASGKFRISTLNQGIGTRALRYNPVTKLITYSDTTSSVNIYNSDGTLTGNRELDGDGNNLTFTAVRKFSLSGDSLDYTLDPAGNLRIGLGNQQFIMRADTASLSRRLSYTGNLGSSFTKHTLVDKNYVDSSITASPSGTVTSVGLSMPTAFAVANSPVTSSGTLTVTGAGVASQYIRGDGQLATLPTTGGGGSSVSYYLNGSVNQGTFSGTPYYEMSKTAIFGAGTDFTISSNGYIASFITDAGDPALLNIPAGNWDFEVYFQSSSTSGTPSFYVELYKYDGSIFTLIASSSANPEFITGGTSVDAYYTPLAVPSTSLLVTDRLAVRIYVNNSGNTITLHTEDNNLCQIITTFSTGINALNGLTSQVQYLATGTSGTDFNISSLTDTHTFNLPTASATNRGALSSADWTTFNSKIGPSDTASMLSPYLRKVDTTAMLSPYKTFYPRTAISLTTTGTSGAATYDNSTGVLNVPQYADQFTGTVTSVATNTATGITGGTITTTGTLAIDTNLISTRAWRQKGIDSVASLANSKIDGSGTTNYVAKFTASGTIGNSQIFDNGTNVGIGTISPTNGKFQIDAGTSVPIVALTTNSDVARYFSSVTYAGFRVIAPINTGVPYIGLNTSSSIGTYDVGNQKAFFAYWSDNSGYASLGYGSTSHAIVYRVNNGNVIVGGGTTDAGYKLDVNGTARINGVLTFGSTPTLESFNGNTMLKLTASLGLTISSDRWNSNTSSSSYIQNGYTTKNFITTNAANGTFNSFDFSASNAYQPTIANPYTQKLINGAMTINSTAATNSFHGVSISTTDNSASIANNVFAVYADATLGTNTSATRWAGYFVGRGYFSQVLAIGTTSPNASALLDITSTTKGFLPPRMTGAQAELIGTPAAGLMVYANNGNGVTITSIGWWGYNGTTWVKLN